VIIPARAFVALMTALKSQIKTASGVDAVNLNFKKESRLPCSIAPVPYLLKVMV
jgi:hypothetical protein